MKKFCFIVVLLLNVGVLMGQDYVWNKVNHAGGASWDLATDMIFDSEKNLYLVGGFEQTVYFGKDSLVSSGNRDIFIAKYDNLLNLIWLKSAGGKEYDNVNSIKIDNENNIVITGNFRDTAYFDSESLISGDYMNNFIAKYNKTGGLMWVKKINADTRANRTFVTVGSSNNVYCSGSFYNSIILNDSVRAKGETDIYVAEYSDGGNYINSFVIGGSDKDVLKDIKYKNGKFYMLCEFNNKFSGVGDTLYSYGNADIVTIETDSTGNLLKTSHAAGFFNDNAACLQIDDSLNVFVAGSFENTIFFGSDSLISSGQSDVFIAKYDNNLNLLRLNQLTGSSIEMADNMLINSDNSLYLTGTFRDSLNSEGFGIFADNYRTDMFIAKFDGNGTAKGLRQSGGKKGNFGNILLNDKDNYLYLLGNFSYNFAFETDSISTDSIFNANVEDIFFAKFFDCDNADKLQIGKDTTFCGSGTLEGNAGFKKYVWNTGQKTSRITVNQTNDYKLSAIDRHKCPVASNLVHIIVNEKPYVFLGNDIYTAGSENFVLSGGDFAGYSWSRGDTTKTIEVNSNNLNVGINSFSLTAKNGLGCKAVDEINIVVESPSYSVGNPNYLQITNIAGKTSSNKQTEHNLGSLSNVLSMPEGSVYPNPSTGKFSVKIGGLFETKDVDVYVTDEKGQTVFNKRYLNRNVIDIVLKTAGVYVVNVKSGDKVFCGKVVVE